MAASWYSRSSKKSRRVSRKQAGLDQFEAFGLPDRGHGFPHGPVVGGEGMADHICVG